MSDQWNHEWSETKSPIYRDPETSDCEKAAERLENHTRFFAIGMGKSGIAALAFVRYATSFGLDASLLSMDDLMHGGMGLSMAPKWSALMIFSDSGETKELVDLRDTPLFNLTWAYIGSSEQSSIGRISQVRVVLPEFEWEQGVPVNTTLSQVQAAISLAMNIAAQKNQIAAVQFHPANQTASHSTKQRDATDSLADKSCRQECHPPS